MHRSLAAALLAVLLAAPPALAQWCSGIAEGMPCDTVPGVCDASEVCVTPLTLTKVRMRGERAPELNNGPMFLRGTFDTFPPEDSFDVLSGLTVRVTDALNLDVTFTWTPEECQTFPPGGIRCRKIDAPHKARAKRRGGHPTLWSFTFRFKGNDIQTPFAAPVTFHVSHGSGVDREGSITDVCTIKPGNGALNCKAPK